MPPDENTMSDTSITLPHVLNALGCCFYLPSDSPEVNAVRHFFAEPAWRAVWPGGDDPALEALLPHLTPTAATVASDWQRLFAGPEALPAPPWGSVYLDAEGVLRGDSTLALRGFLQREGLRLHTASPEPEDHLGLLLFQAAVLAAEGREAALLELLRDHLHWLPLFICRLRQHGGEGFYLALAELTHLTLQTLMAGSKKPA